MFRFKKVKAILCCLILVILKFIVSDLLQYNKNITLAAIEVQSGSLRSDLSEICPAELIARQRRQVKDPSRETDFQLSNEIMHSHKIPFPLPLGNLTHFCDIMNKINRPQEYVPEYCKMSESKRSFIINGKTVFDKTFLNDRPLGMLFPCSNKSYVGSLQNVYLDYGSEHLDVPGTIFDEKRYFTLNTYDKDEWIPHCDSNIIKTFQKHKILASGLTVYGGAFAHALVELLPRFLFLYNSIPQDIPILVQKGPLEQFSNLLHDADIIDKYRLVWYEMSGSAKTLVFAEKLYFVAENPVCGYRHGDPTGFQWQPPELLSEVRKTFHFAAKRIKSDDFNSTLEEIVHKWELNIDKFRSPFTLPEQQHLWNLLASRLKKESGSLDLILLANRCKTQTRRISNLPEVMEALQVNFPHLRNNLAYFCADDLPLEVIIDLFKHVKILLSPHGATLGHIMWLPEGANVVEVTYVGTEVMPFPANYYYTIAVNLNLNYAIVPGYGSYNTPMRVNPKDIVDLVQNLLK